MKLLKQLLNGMPPASLTKRCKRSKALVSLRISDPGVFPDTQLRREAGCHSPCSNHVHCKVLKQEINPPSWTFLTGSASSLIYLCLHPFRFWLYFAFSLPIRWSSKVEITQWPRAAHHSSQGFSRKEDIGWEVSVVCWPLETWQSCSRGKQTEKDGWKRYQCGEWPGMDEKLQLCQDWHVQKYVYFLADFILLSVVCCKPMWQHKNDRTTLVACLLALAKL